MKIQNVFDELEKTVGDKVKTVKQMFAKGYLTQEMNHVKVPPQLAKFLDTVQQRRFKRVKFTSKHTTNDIKTYLRHLLKVMPNDTAIQECFDKIKVPFAYLKYLADQGRIVDFVLDLQNVQDEVIDVAFVFMPETDQQKIVEEVNKVIQSTPH